MTDKPDFSELLNKGYNFDLGKSIGDGWKLFSKSAGNFIGFTLVWIIISMPISFLLALIPIPFFSNIVGIAFNVLFAGIFVFCRNLMTGKEEFGDFFKGFQSFGQILLHYLVYYLMMVPIFILLFILVLPPDFYELFTNTEQLTQAMQSGGFVQGFQFGPVEWLGFLLCFVGFLYLGIAYIFAVPLIIDAKLGFWEAMELSRKVVSKKFFSFFGLLIILVLMVSIGTLITCGLGMLVMVPFSSCAIFMAYDSIFTPYLNSMDSQIETFGSGDENLDMQRDN